MCLEPSSSVPVRITLPLASTLKFSRVPLYPLKRTSVSLAVSGRLAVIKPLAPSLYPSEEAVPTLKPEEITSTPVVIVPSNSAFPFALICDVALEGVLAVLLKPTQIA